MRFLVDEGLPRSTTELLKRYGHEAWDVRDIGYRGFPDYRIAAYAKQEGLCIVTGDLDFSDVRNYPPEQYFGIVVFRLPHIFAASSILNLLESFLNQPEIFEVLSGKLAIVESGRIRLRG